MKIRSLLSLGILSIALCFFAFKMDDGPFDQLLKKLDEYSKKYPQEKAYLHLDKPYYAIGDDIWFKAYVVDTKTGSPTDLSKILYVDLIDEKDSVKKQLKLALMSGITWGDFKLTDSLAEGNYRIRAYTKYMRNFSSDFFYDKTIKIGNSWSNKVFTKTDYSFVKDNGVDKVLAKIHFEDKNGIAYKEQDVAYEVQLDDKNVAKGRAKTSLSGDVEISFASGQSLGNKAGKITATLTMANRDKVVKSIPITSTSANADVQFFPEGGNLIAELPQKVAVKVVNPDGKGENITGRVIDNEGNEVTSLETKRVGMGSFVVNAQENKTYTAKIKFKDGSEKDFKLPVAQKSGYAFSLSNLDTAKITMKIMASDDLINGSELKIVAQQAGNVYYVSKAKIDKQVVQANILKKDLPSGIIQFTLFSSDNQPIAERMVFVKNPVSDIDVNLNASGVSATKRGKATFTFDAKNEKKPVMGSFSVAVTNSNKVVPDEENESNILTSLLLTSDLIGYVEKPNYYFLKNDVETNRNLDNLMLTQGYRRYIWKNVINNLEPKITFQPEKSMSISGTVTKGNKPVVGGKVMILSTKGGFFVLDTVTNAEGKFSFNNLIFGDSTRFVVQARAKADRKFVDINLDLQPGQIVSKNKNTGDIEVNVNNSLMSYIKSSDNYFNEMTRLGLLERTIKLDEVTVTEKRKNPAKNSSNLNGPGNADFILSGENLNSCVSLLQCLSTYLPGVIQQGDSLYLMRSQDIPMSVIVDGIRLDADFLDNIPPADIESIELLKSVGNTAIYGGEGLGGILIITTKRGGDYSYNRYTPGVVTIRPRGYSVSRAFYSPKYDVPPKNNRPDLRTTIYWNPQVISDKEGHAKFEYYNADEPGKYRVVIEGIDIMGNLARKVYTYEVK